MFFRKKIIKQPAAQLVTPLTFWFFLEKKHIIPAFGGLYVSISEWWLKHIILCIIIYFHIYAQISVFPSCFPPKLYTLWYYLGNIFAFFFCFILLLLFLFVPCMHICPFLYLSFFLHQIILLHLEMPLDLSFYGHSYMS